MLLNLIALELTFTRASRKTYLVKLVLSVKITVHQKRPFTELVLNLIEYYYLYMIFKMGKVLILNAKKFCEFAKFV